MVLLPVPAAALLVSGTLLLALPKAGKNFKEIQETVVATYRDQALKQSVIYDIIRLVKDRKINKRLSATQPKKTARNPALKITAVSTTVAENACVSIQDFADGTFYSILHRGWAFKRSLHDGC